MNSRRLTAHVRVAALALALACAALAPAAAQLQGLPEAFVASLSAAERQEVEAWRQARGVHEAETAAYWRGIETRRAARRQKKAAGQPLVPADYVREMPPVYAGPQLGAALLKRLAAAQPPDPPKDPDSDVSTVAECLEQARAVYGFVPRRVAEAEFKRLYALEALAQGLAKDHVVRVFAFETGGKGTYSMQAGVDPVTGQGRAISTALGYAQLLAANSANELVKHGAGFATRLEEWSRKRSLTPERVKELKRKAAMIRRMLKDLATVPNEWKAHRAYARTPKGMAVHTLNLDADVGPWLQVLKLKGLREDAAKAGVFSLTGAEIELMNLSGPATGLEMMLPVAKAMPSANFFERGGYERNSVVRGRTAQALLAEIETRMMQFLLKPGAIEFAAIFDRLAAAKKTAGQ